MFRFVAPVLVLCLPLTSSCGDKEDTGTEPPVEYEGDEAGECTDGADNDQDGLFDCDDEGCAGSPDCEEADTDTDSDADSDTDSDADTDVNTAPGAPDVAIEPSAPLVYDDLECLVVTPSTDPDGDEVSYGYTWTVNEAAAGITDTVVGATRTGEGESWACTVTPSDGIDEGTPASDTVEVAACSCLDFDATNAGVEVPSFSLGSSAFTAEAWVYVDAHASMLPIMTFGEGGGESELSMATDSAGVMYAVTVGLNSVGATSSSVPERTWVHLAWVYNGTGFSEDAFDFFVAGVKYPADLRGGSTSPIPPSAGMTIGRRARTSNVSFDGLIDQVRVSSGIRYYADFTPPSVLEADSDTIGLWMLDEGSGSSTLDTSGNGHDGTIVGATWNPDSACSE